jgi:nucleotide-binding universal stress UspA family protein
MVAWDGGRESSRAVRGALPLLGGAGKTVVVAVNPKKGKEGTRGEDTTAELCEHLARHDVEATAKHVVSHDLQVCDALLSRAVDEDVNLMISGAYSNSRTREKLLGGVTRQLLEQMTLPVLMSN